MKGAYLDLGERRGAAVAWAVAKSVAWWGARGAHGARPDLLVRLHRDDRTPRVLSGGEEMGTALHLQLR